MNATAVEVKASGKAVRRLWTTDQFLRLAELGQVGKREYLWDGEILEAMGKNPPHCGVETTLSGMLRDAYRDDRHTVLADCPLRLRDGRLPQPDFMVVRGGRDIYYRRLAEPADVLFLIEVADTSYAVDASEMLAAYAAAAIPVYVIANIPARRFEIYSEPDPGSGTYRARIDYEVGSIAQILDVAIPVADVFRFLP